MTTLQVRGSASSHSTSPATPASTAPATARPDTPRSYRPDIEGLRAVAVLTVVLYHAGLGLPGGYVGVDVFFVISGFLITRQLVGSVEARGIAALPVFYAHRVRRLLPAAVLVVIATVAAARMWAPVLQVRDIAVDAVVTTVYGLNYRLAAAGTDYQHLGTAASPLQHFWSLAVEEQFYLLWPLVVAALLAAGRSRGRLLLGVAVAAVVVASSIASVQVTSSSAPWAYFSLHTRAWELGVGALLALTAVPLSRVPRRLAGLCGWTGLVAIVAAAARYSDATPFPGTAAWLPVGGAAAVIAAGCGPRVGVERVLGEPLIQCLGRISYAWYLWHWPMLVLAPHVVGHELSTLESCAVLWLSLATSLVTYLLVEEPARRIRLPTLRWLALGGLLSATVVGASVLVITYAPSVTGSGATTSLAATSDERRAPGVVRRAVAKGLNTVAAPRNLTPQPADASDSLPHPSTEPGTHNTYELPCQAGFTQIEQDDCVYGDPKGTKTVVLFGDSRMEQWFPAVNAMAIEEHWRVITWTKAACPAARLTVVNPVLNREYTECDQWRAGTVARIRALRPELVIVGQSENVASSSVPPTTFAAATVQTLSELRRDGHSRVVYVQDTPIPQFDLPACVAANLGDVRACTFALDKAHTYPDRHRALAPALRAAGFGFVDPQRWFCSSGRCAAVVGNVLVYRDQSHMTVPYSRWLAPALWPAIQRAGRTGKEL
ncbi:MAG TPA: acyltransferase family protein [Nocardioidaceae bacterium]|nr:acyltransferase family protein [Nocardioidaceae bacterium]